LSCIKPDNSLTNSIIMTLELTYRIQALDPQKELL
jgi:hypothetical protein